MVAFKAADVESFIARPDPARPVVLLYGPDAGLVSERAAALVRASVDDPGDPFAFALLSADTLADTPERLVEEAHTIPLFGGRRAVRVRAAGRNVQPAVERVLAAPPPGTDCRVIIETGDLRKTAPLRTLCEKSAVAAALPCYPDTPRDLARLIDEETGRAGVTITAAARNLLTTLIGGDRRASRSEIEKLILYAGGGKRIDVPDVIAVVSDATNPVMDSLIDAAFAGFTGDVETHFARVRASGTSASAIAGALVRQTAALHLLRMSVDSGAAVDDLLKRQAVHFSRARAVRAALQAWTARRLERLIGQLGDVSLEVRRSSKLGYPLIERALLMIARAARSRE
ncbi:MAG: DNA polymerase III subunit delta [Bradyrhizobiaceae bacterium]|nr:DNA polymerase III subunit delta [Bradyrhizobiaceae bacterium]